MKTIIISPQAAERERVRIAGLSADAAIAEAEAAGARFDQQAGEWRARLMRRGVEIMNCADADKATAARMLLAYLLLGRVGAPA
jgi:hypothetical protein